MRKFRAIQTAVIIVFVTISVILFTSCQKEPLPVESDQPSLPKFTLPTGATLLSASFNVLIEAATNQDINVHRITNPWQELAVTWNNFGGSYSPTIEATFNASAIGWTSVDVTNLVEGWLNGTYPNYGLLLDQVNKTWPRTEFDTREYNAAAGAAFLEICYTLNGSVVCDTTRNIGDTYIYQLNPNENNGYKGVMYTGWGYATDLEKQALVKFDLGFTPPPPQVQCETAYAYGGNVATCFLNLSPINANNWGWTNYIGEGSYDWPIYAGAGQCNISNGTLVGNLSVEYFGGTVTITYELDPGFNLDDTHVWVGTTPLPIKKGKYTTAPGQFNHNFKNPVVVNGLSGNIYIAAHAGVCWEY